MNLNQPTLTYFEIERKANNFIPPLDSNSFYNIGDGVIDIFTEKNERNNIKMDIKLQSGEMKLGDYQFIFYGDKGKDLYRNLITLSGTTLINDNYLCISSGRFDIYGSYKMEDYSTLYVRDGATVYFHPNSTFEMGKDVKIFVDGTCEFVIYGNIITPLSYAKVFLSIQNITIDSTAVMNVTGLEELGDRIYSMTDYALELNNEVTINKYTQGEKNFQDGRIGYTWADGDPNIKSQHITMSLLWGSAILGDFKFSLLGLLQYDEPNLQTIIDLKILKDTTLHITESYLGYKYVMPELYIGEVVYNTKRPGVCYVGGNIIVDGENCCITLDRGGMLKIYEEGKVCLFNGAKIKCTNNSEDDVVLNIEGTLMIDDIEQLEGFESGNIVFGEDGKLIILNPERDERRLLFSTPNGILDSYLYKLFRSRIDHIEYHVCNNTGIKLDRNYEFFSREMIKWFGDRRIEQAIKDGILVWHDGGFIELDHEIIPWVNMNCTLLEASRIFKSFGSYDSDRLQEVVDRLKYAECGNIVFRFIDKDEFVETTLVLDSAKMESVINHPLTNMYVLTTDADGTLFIRNKIGSVSDNKIINEQSKSFPIKDKKCEFPL